MITPPEIAILGIDGATWDLIVPWAREGLLPNFARLIDKGTWGDLHSTVPPVTAPAWTSFMTGKNPGKHGLYDFFETDPETYGITYACAASRKAKTIWRLLSDSGKRVGVVNVPMTYPPEEISGFMISGMDTPDANSAFVHPGSLKTEIEKEVGPLRLDIQHLGYMKNDRIRGKVLAELVELEKYRLKLILHLLTNHPVDVFMTVFNATDQVQHHFWHYMDPGHHFYDAEGAKAFGNAILTIYQCIDEIIGILLKTFSDKTTVVLMSDHGFGPTSPLNFYINRHLEERGILSLQDGEKSGTLSTFMGKIDALLRSTLPPDLKRAITRLVPWARAKLESYLSFSMIDWSRTKAYAVEISPTSPAIWVNLEGRNGKGIVKRHEYDDVVESVRQSLYEVQDPRDGTPLVSKIYRKEEIYSGKELDKAPDLLLSWWEGKGFIAKQSYPPTDKARPVVEYRSGEMADGKDWSGTHSINGIVLFHGNGIGQGRKIEGSDILDLAPTLLYLLNEAVPDDMDGKVLMDIFEKNREKLAPVGYSEAGGADEKTSGAYSEEDSMKIRKRLQDLGYMS